MSTIDRLPAGETSRTPHEVPISIAMFDRMIDAGVFDGGDDIRLELLSGRLNMMSPIGDRHADAVDWLARWSILRADGADVLVRVQNPLTLPASQSVPQPDIAWVTRRRYADRRPRADEVALLVEVAETSLDFDTGPKAALYAAAGIPDYWVIDLVGRAVVVFRDPRDGLYETRSTHRGSDPVRPLADPEITLVPADLFGTGVS